MKLKVYSDRISPPSRAVLLFCKINGVDFEEITVNVFKGQNHSPEYQAINPMSEVPAILHGRFKLFERYPSDLFRRTKINSLLDWYHLNLFIPTGLFLFNTTIGTARGFTLSPQVAAEAEKLLKKSLAKIESFWLKGNGKFLLGSSHPSIADLLLVCCILQLQLADEMDYEQIVSPHKKVLQWIEDTKAATQPHFDQVHKILFKVKEKFRRDMPTKIESMIKVELQSKI